MILDQFRLDGRVAAVTGSSRGLGQGCAAALAEAGADVALLDRSPAERTRTLVEGAGRRCARVSIDLSTATGADYERVVAQTVERFGRLDILVNNAGTIRRAPALGFPASDWDEVLRVDLSAVFHLSQAAGRVMAAQGCGKIINVASLLSFQGGVLVPSYTAAKHGVAGLTKALANEWAAANINVNAIAPGYMATDNTAPLRQDPARAAAILDRIPAGRWGTADDVMGAVVFLASDAARYVHGSILAVDGGWLAR